MVAESVLVKHQLLILNRSRKRSPNLRCSDRIVAGLCALLMRRGRLIRSAIILTPSTLFGLHRALTLCRHHAIIDHRLRTAQKERCRHDPRMKSRSYLHDEARAC